MTLARYRESRHFSICVLHAMTGDENEENEYRLSAVADEHALHHGKRAANKA